jgi:hypothetical protein
MEWLVSTLGSSAFNGLVGFVGSWVSKREERKALKDEYEYKLAAKQMEIEEAANERHHELEVADKQIERAQVEGDIEIEKADVGAFTVSQQTLGKLKGFLRLVRPIITFYLLTMTTVLAIGLWVETDGFAALEPWEHKEMLLLVLNQLLALTSMCVGWWFGSRGGNIK